MPKPVDFLAEALVESGEAAQWYDERNPAVANAFLKELDDAVIAMAASPSTWPAHIHGTRRLLLKQFPFTVIYRDSTESIVVIAVAHQRREPGYWRVRGSG